MKKTSKKNLLLFFKTLPAFQTFLFFSAQGYQHDTPVVDRSIAPGSGYGSGIRYVAFCTVLASATRQSDNSLLASNPRIGTPAHPQRCELWQPLRQRFPDSERRRIRLLHCQSIEICRQVWYCDGCIIRWK